MKQLARILQVLLATALLPGLAFGQGILPGISFGGSSGGCAPCGGDPGGGFPAVYAGYTDNRKGMDFTVQTRGGAVFGITGLKLNMPTRGLWVGASYTASLGDSFAVEADGWYLFPGGGKNNEEYETVGGGVGFGAGAPTSRWSTDYRHWYVDGLGLVGGKIGFALIGGLRYNYYDVKFKSPSSTAFVVFPTDTADLNAREWLPLFGAQYAMIGLESRFTARILIAPWVFGQLRYRENFTATGWGSWENAGNYKKGEFGELFLDYTKVSGSAEIGAFFRYSVTRGHATLDTDGVPLAGVAAASDVFDVTFTRPQWTLGLKAGISF